jgi:hypothetical protein
MTVHDILMIVALVCVIWSITSLMIIAGKVSKSGTRVHFFLISLYFFRYMAIYEDMTRKEKGRRGPLIYHFVIPLWIALILVLVWVIISLGN